MRAQQTVWDLVPCPTAVMGTGMRVGMEPRGVPAQRPPLPQVKRRGSGSSTSPGGWTGCPSPALRVRGAPGVPALHRGYGELGRHRARADPGPSHFCPQTRWGATPWGCPIAPSTTHGRTTSGTTSTSHSAWRSRGEGAPRRAPGTALEGAGAAVGQHRARQWPWPWWGGGPEGVPLPPPPGTPCTPHWVHRAAPSSSPRLQLQQGQEQGRAAGELGAQRCPPTRGRGGPELQHPPLSPTVPHSTST